MENRTPKTRRIGLAPLIAVVLLSAAWPLRAQTNFFDLSITQAMETSQLSNSLFQMRMATGAQSGGNDGGARRPAKKLSPQPARNRKTTFKPVTTHIMPAMFAKAVGDAAKKLYKPGGGTDQLYFQLDTLDKLDFMRWLFNYDDKMRVRDGGIYRNDVAYAAGEMIIEFQLRTTNRALTAKQVQGLRRQMWRYFETNREFQKLSNEKKQQLYETYVLLGQYMRWCYDETRGGKNKPISDAVRGAAQTQLERFLGAPMSRIAFTDNGVARR